MTATSPPLGPPMHHVFMDFENVHQVDLGLIGAKSVSFTLLVGPQQAKLDASLVEKLMEHSASVRLVKLKSKAKNAVDFALAYYLGQAALADPAASFHIISKDGGYDPLIAHLRERHVDVQRQAACADLAFSWAGKSAATGKAHPEAAPAKKAAAKKVAVKTAAKKAAKKAAGKLDSVEARMERVLKDFREHPDARPKKRTALLAKIGNLIGKPSGGQEVAGVLERMTRTGKLAFDEKDVPVYTLPDG